MSGYWITYQGFLPVGRSLDEQIAGSKALLGLEDAMRAAGVVDVIRKDKFVTNRKSKAGPSPQERAVETTAQPPAPQAQGNEADSPDAASAEQLLEIPDNMRRPRPAGQLPVDPRG